MYNLAILRQPAGIGDIFYALKIGHTVRASKVLWPVKDIYFDAIAKHIEIRNDRNIEFCKVSDFLKNSDPEEIDFWTSEVKKVKCYGDNKIFIPLQFSDTLPEYNQSGVMKAKYKMVNCLDSDWSLYFNFKRDKKREDDLFKHFGLKDDDEYIVVSENYGTPPDYQTYKLPSYNDNDKRKIIKIDFVEGYNVFDFCKIFENAQEIHMLETCFCYILEKLNLKSKVFNLYNRHVDSINHRHVINIPRKIKWNFRLKNEN